MNSVVITNKLYQEKKLNELTKAKNNKKPCRIHFGLQAKNHRICQQSSILFRPVSTKLQSLGEYTAETQDFIDNFRLYGAIALVAFKIFLSIYDRVTETDHIPHSHASQDAKSERAKPGVEEHHRD